MKAFYLLGMIGLLLACKNESQQTAPAVENNDTSTVSVKLPPAAPEGVWFRSNAGSWNGLQLEPGGVLKFPNIYSMAGDSWEQKGDTLILYSRTERYPEKQPTSYLIAGLDSSRLVLRLLNNGTAGNEEAYEKITISKESDHLLGRWTGVEGTYLDVIPNRSKNGYTVQIKTLDGPMGSYEGAGEGNRIRFTRKGAVSYLQATDGKATGMKWLADKTNCVTIAPGEGFCR